MSKSIDKQKSLIKNIILKAVSMVDSEKSLQDSNSNGTDREKDEYLLSLYFELKNLIKYFPVIESYVGNKYVLNKNEILLATALKRIGLCLGSSYYVNDLTYGLLMGGMSYVDILERNVYIYNRDEFDAQKPADKYAKDEVREYYSNYQNDLSHIDELSYDAQCLITECIISVVLFNYLYPDSGKDIDLFELCEFYNMNGSLTAKVINEIEMINVDRINLYQRRAIDRLVEMVHNVYPVNSYELSKIAKAILKSLPDDGIDDVNMIDKSLWNNDDVLWIILSDVYNMLNSEIHMANKNIYAISEAQSLVADFYNQEEFAEFVRCNYIDNLNFWNKNDNKRFFVDYYFKGTKLQKAWMKENDAFIKLMSDTETIDETVDYYISNSYGFILRRLYENDFKEEKVLSGVLDSVMDLFDKLFSDKTEDYEYKLNPDYESKTIHIDRNEARKNRIITRLNSLHESQDKIDFNLSEEGKKRIDEFVIGKLQINNDINAKNGTIFPYSNLILSIDEADFSDSIIAELAKAITGDDKKYTILDSDKWKTRNINRESVDALFQGVDDNKIICIKSFTAHPELDYETASTGNAMIEQIEIGKTFNRLWKLIVDTAQAKPEISFVIVTNQYVWESFRKNTELYYRTFRHHVRVIPMTREQVYNRCLVLLKEDKSFEFSEDFETELKKYMDAVYDEAELKGDRFAVDLRNRIYSLYYAKIRDEKIIASDCIPKYNSDVQTPEMILRSLDDLVGLNKVSETVRGIYTGLLYDKSEKAKREGKKEDKKKGDKRKRPLHMLFTGNPGTGKTTVARKMGDLFFSMGLTDKRKVIEVKPTDIVSGWRNVSVRKMMQKIEEATGGILFVDEAYGFVNGSENGMLALQTLLTEMENNPDRMVVIMAGYEDEMKELLASNLGLKSRFAFEIKFEDYSIENLKEIFYKWLREDGFELDNAADQVLEDAIRKKRAEKFFGNARDVRNIYDEARRNWSSRMINKSFDEKIIKSEDFGNYIAEKNSDDASFMLEDMIGLNNIKNKIEEFKNQVTYQKYLSNRGIKISDFSMHMLFTGNPGTGKTTVAKMIAKELYSIGILKTDKLTVVEKKDLIAGYVGQTPMKTDEVIKRATDGVLFIDEAYSLDDSAGNNKGFGHEAIETLITAMEEKKDSLIVIFAGYTEEMKDFLNMNPGISSRIGYTFEFEDYKPDELVEIYKKKMAASGFKTSDAALKKVHDIMYFFSSVPNFGNGRFVDRVMHQILLKRAARFDINNVKKYRDITVADIPTHKEIIENAANRSKLYDPAKITKEEIKKTAIHECGHAVVMYVTGLETSKGSINNYIPKSISAKGKVGSLGRVELPERTGGNMSELDMRNEIAILLAGRNAERVFYGYNTTGVSSDYRRAKKYAENMIKIYAMGEIGKTTAMSILKDEDARATRIIEEKKDFIEYLANKLLDDKDINGELSGDEFVKIYKEFYKK